MFQFSNDLHYFKACCFLYELGMHCEKVIMVEYIIVHRLLIYSMYYLFFAELNYSSSVDT